MAPPAAVHPNPNPSSVLRAPAGGAAVHPNPNPSSVLSEARAREGSCCSSKRARSLPGPDGRPPSLSAGPSTDWSSMSCESGPCASFELDGAPAIWYRGSVAYGVRVATFTMAADYFPLWRGAKPLTL